MSEPCHLIPCPFCGEKDELYPCYDDMGNGNGPCFAIDCLGCGIEFKPRKGRDVFAAWNRRTDATQAGTAS